jgi:hypothetical protein
MTSHPNFDRTQAALDAARQGDYAPAFDAFTDDVLMENGPGPGPGTAPREGRPGAAAAGVCVLAGRDLPPRRPVRLRRRPRGYLPDPRDRNRPRRRPLRQPRGLHQPPAPRWGKPNGCGPLTLTPSTVKPSGRKTPAHPRRTFLTAEAAPSPGARSGRSCASSTATTPTLTPTQSQARLTRTRSPPFSACQLARRCQKW